MPRPRSTKASKANQTPESAEAANGSEAVKNTDAPTSTQLVCTECGRTFTRAASLGAHRRQTHNIAGATSRARKRPGKAAAATTVASKGRRRQSRTRTTAAPANSNARDSAPNRDALLRTLFPTGIPAKESVIRSVNAWLEEAERLARLR